MHKTVFTLQFGDSLATGKEHVFWLLSCQRCPSLTGSLCQRGSRLQPLGVPLPEHGADLSVSPPLEADVNEFKQAYTAVFLPSPACRADLSPRDLNHFPLLLCVKSHSLKAQKRGLCAVAVEFSSWSFKPTAGTADSQGTSRIAPEPCWRSKTFACDLTGTLLLVRSLHAGRSTRGAATRVHLRVS